MTLREFLQDNTVTQLELVDNIIFNVICDGVPYGLNVDTSSILSGTKLILVDDFILDEYNLTCNGIVLDLDITEML